MLQFETFPVGPLACTCILAWDAAEGRGVVVDPGGEADLILKRVTAKGFQVEAILLTHGHFDHLGAAHELQALWDVPVHLHPEDAFLLEKLELQTGLLGLPVVPAPCTSPMVEGQTLYGLTVIHTPGHTPGGCCLLGDSERGPVLLAGDTLFQGGVGRTDLWGGHWEALERSILEKLYVLPDATRVHPGHGPSTTLGEEAEGNPYVRRRG